jgi:hypothetical protein
MIRRLIWEDEKENFKFFNLNYAIFGDEEDEREENIGFNSMSLIR